MQERLIIDWENLPTYNTIMALFTGISLISVARLGRLLTDKKEIHPLGWSVLFGMLGVVLVLTGAHMTLTWPLAKYFPFDNILFGEPALALGVLNLGTAVYLWKQTDTDTKEVSLQHIAKEFKPFGVLFYGLALMLMSIFFAGIDFQFFAAPKEEPISGYFSDYPWLESWGLSLVFLGVGIAVFLTAGFFNRASEDHFSVVFWDQLNYAILLMCGWFFLLFGAINYYTHIGLILNTMK